MPKRKATAKWEGSVKEGSGTVALGSGAFQGPYSFKSRFEEGDQPGTNPEELIGAAHAGCFAMALSNILTEAGTPPESLAVEALVEVRASGGDISIPTIRLTLGPGPRHRRRRLPGGRERGQGGLPSLQGARGRRRDHARRHARELAAPS